MIPSINLNKRSVAIDNNRAKRQKLEIDEKIDRLVETILTAKRLFPKRIALLKQWFVLRGQLLPKRLHKVQPNTNTIYAEPGDNLLHIAIKMQHLRLVKLLIRKVGIDPHETNQNGKTAYHTIVNFVPKKCYAETLSNYPPRLRQLKFENIEVLRFTKHFYEQIGKYADLNAQDENGNTFLHHFFSVAQDDCRGYSAVYLNQDFSQFIPMHPELTLENNQKLTPYELAAKNHCRSQFLQMIKYMEENGQYIKSESNPEHPEGSHISDRMEVYRNPPETFPLFENIVQRILKKLNWAELAAFGAVNRHAKVQLETAMLFRARRFGMDLGVAMRPSSYIDLLLNRVKQCEAILPIELVQEAAAPTPFCATRTIGKMLTANAKQLFQLFSQQELYGPDFEMIRNIFRSRKFKGGIVKNGEVVDGVLALRLAAHHGDLSVAKILLNQGANLNLDMPHPRLATNNHFNNSVPLAWAAQAGHLDVVNLFLSSGADVNSLKTNSNTALLFACGHGSITHFKPNIEVVELLLKSGADCTITTFNGETPLHFASLLGLANIVELLIDHGVEINKCNNQNVTALSMACGTRYEVNDTRPNPDVVRLLLKHGADPMIASWNGLTPLDVATRNGFLEIVDILEMHLAGQEVR